MRLILVALLLLCSCGSIFTSTSFKFTPTAPARLEKRLSGHKSGQDGPKHYAVLIAGHSELRHRNNLSISYQVLLEQGYNSNNIFILDSEGGTPPQFPITDQTNLQSLKMLLKWLADTVTENDSVLFYLTGHGKRDNNKSFFMLNKSETYEKSDFIKLVSLIRPNVGIIITDLCYWGAEMSPNYLKEYMWISATDDTHTSHGTTFGRAFWGSFREFKENKTSILDAYVYSVTNDTGTLKGNNHPGITYVGNNPKDFDILGKNLYIE